jgi:predicted type IV restriction endonuclease
MNLKHVISDIVANLARWERTGLNEAQTRQVMVLRLFAALDYDIWNPFEVIAEQNSGGGSGGYIPDFTLRVAKKKAFIVEVKALGKKFDDNDCTQAVNYVNSMGLRWAILTNGKQWLLFDNKQEGVATDRLALIIDITTPYASDYLAELLSPKVWESDHANQTVWQAIQFLKLESKLRQIMQKGFARDRDGLELAMEVRLNADERQLAESHFEALCHRLFSVEPTSPMPPPVFSTSVLPARETKETSFPLPISSSRPTVMKSQTEILQVLREQIELVSQTTSVHGFDITAMLNGVEIKVKGWLK